MVEEQVVALTTDHHKRKLHPDHTPPPPEPHPQEPDNGAVTPNEFPDASESKRPRLHDQSEPDNLEAEGGNENEKDDTVQQNSPQIVEALEKVQPVAEEASIIENDESTALEDAEKENTQPDDVELPSSTAEQLENVVKPTEDEPQPVTDIPQQGGDTEQSLSESGHETTSRKMEVPNNMVGVLIGKAGETIRSLQTNSGAKIQITRDIDANPEAATRPVELVGTLASINKAERLIKEVIVEADAGGSPALVARGFALAAGTMEQIEIQVPNDKVGLVIGKGGETIKNLQTRSNARIQLIPQHLPEGDTSKERTVRISGDKKQIDMARELIKEVMNQNVKQSTFLSNHGQQQGYRPRFPSGAVSQWGHRAPHNGPSMPYDYQQHRGGPYPSQNQQYPLYGGYPSQGPPRGGFGSGWEQRPPMQAPSNNSRGYDYYGGQGGGHPATVPPSGPRPSGPSMGHNTPSHAQANYNYGQPPYSQTHQGYSQPATQQPYGGPYGSSQSGSYQDSQGYPNQQQYPPPYSVPSQVAPPAQSYPASQPGSLPYQAPVTAPPSYGQNVAAQQPYPYGTAPATTNDGYSQPQPAAGSMPGYPQQGGTGSQPVAGYGQPGIQQQAPGYSQGYYGQYPPAQQGYSNQTSAGAASYGYQGQADPSAYTAAQAYSSAPPATALTSYAQPATSQVSHDQSAPQQSGGYPVAAAAAPGAYPQYGASG